MLRTIQYILSEYELSLSTSEFLIGNRVLESILLLFRSVGTAETKLQPPIGMVDARIDLAKQFIRDNIQSPLQVSEVAAYCYVSPKQLTRLFYASEKISPAIYIKKEKIRYIESLLADPTLSLREISDRMCFANEYSFNAFFKKYYGMTPGQYRKMLQ